MYGSISVLKFVVKVLLRCNFIHYVICYQDESMGPQWRSGNILAPHLWGVWFKPRTLCGKVDRCLLMVGSLQNLDHLYVLVSFAHKTTGRDMTYTVFKSTLSPK